jgi:hypothetical protein
VERIRAHLPGAAIVCIAQNNTIAPAATTFQATTIASGSNGVSLPQAMINVASAAGFPNSAGTIFVSTSKGVQAVTYTGTTGTTFTGCAGGTGTMATGNTVTIGGDQERRAREISRIAEMCGFGYVDVCQAFLNLPAATAWQWYENNGSAATDGIHPNATGGTLWANLVFDALFSNQGDGQMRPQKASSFTTGWGRNLVPNGDFSTLGAGNVPTNWNTTGTMTVTKDLVNVFDPKVGYSLKFTLGAAGPARIYQDVLTGANLTRFLGKRVTLVVPMLLNATAPDTTYGQIVIDDGVSATWGIYDSWTYGEWVYRCESHYIDPACTRLRIHVYPEAGVASTTSVTVGGVYLVEGDLPQIAAYSTAGAAGPAGATGATYDYYSTVGTNPALIANGTAVGMSAVLSANNGYQYALPPCPRNMTITKLRWATGGSVSGNYDIAILDSSGNRLWSKGSTAFPTASTVVTETVSSVALTQGQIYYIEFACDNTTAQVYGHKLPAVTGFSALWDLAATSSPSAIAVSAQMPIPAAPGIGASNAAQRMIVTLHEA